MELQITHSRALGPQWPPLSSPSRRLSSLVGAVGVVVAAALFTVFGNGPAQAAEPGIHEVYLAVEAGRLDEAQTMMNQVLQAHPNSAKAHYVEAEILVRQGRRDEARTQLADAERLAPDGTFAKAQDIASLHARINAPSAVEPAGRPAVTSAPFAVPASRGSQGGFPWGVALIVGLVALIAWRMVSRRRTPVAAPLGYGPGPGPMAPGYPQYPAAGYPPAGGGIGSGIMGGLATGVAVGAGMAAGEALAHDLMGEHHHAGNYLAADPVVPQAPQADDTDFGASDPGAGWDSGGGGSDGGGGDWN